jgi:dephospho-CoA kinase
VILFGLTGGIASGKSAVAQRFAERGVPIIDADVLAREVVQLGTSGLAEVVRAFGPGVLAEDGSLDRKALAARVFGDEEKRKSLNAILHPRITALTMQRAQDLGQRGEPLACYDAALLVENGVADAFRPLVVVSAPVDVQIARIVARDGATAEEAKARIAAQMPLAAKVALADYVIDNRGTLADLRSKADVVLEALCTKAGVNPSRYATGTV